MSLLMFLHEEDRFRIMTDTYATTVEGEPFSLVDKCFTFPSRNMVVASTGVANLVLSWVAFLRESVVALDHTQIDGFAQSVLQRMWAEIAEEMSGSTATATIYHFGFDFHTGEPLRYTYRSTNDFASERAVAGGFGVKPEPAGDFGAPDTEDDWLTLATRVRSEQDAKPMAERIHIGGELVATTLLPGVVISERVMRFDDYADHWNAAAARLATG